MSIIHDVIIPLLTALASYAWPVTVLILALLFHEPIRRLIGIIKRVEVGKNAIEFGDAPSDRLFPKLDEKPAAKDATKQLEQPSGPKWERVANWFWLGGDLITAAQFTLRGAPKKRILYILGQAYHHISELGLADSEPAKQLASLKAETLNLSNADLNREWRAALSDRIYDITRLIDNIMGGYQKDFRPHPWS
jgi:hypothetical protein